MKKKFFGFILLLGIHSSLWAQSYHPIVPDEITYFGTADTSLFLALKVDSVQEKSGQSTYHLFKQLRQMSNACTSPFGASWLGDSVHVNDKGEAIFVNADHSPITIKYNANLGTQWIAYANVSWKAEAKVTAWTKETFVGITDSVKTVTFNILKLDGSDTTHPYDTMQIKLSKSHGMVKLVNFYTWDATVSYPLFVEDRTVLNLPAVGFEKAKVGLVNITGEDIYNLQTGDEIHVEFRQIPPIGNAVTGYNEKLVMLLKFGMTNGAGDLLFTNVYDRTTIEYVTKAIRRDTIYFDYATSGGLYNVPNEHTQGTSIPRIEKVNGQRSKRMYETSLGGDKDSCLTPLVVGGYCPNEYSVYRVGLGGPYYTRKDGICPGTERRLVYYKKGTTEWGTPIVLGVDETPTEAFSSYQLVPNPAREQLILQGYGSDVDVTILDMQGQTLMKSVKVAPSTVLDICHLSPGLYFYQLSMGEKRMRSGNYSKNNTANN